jgi:hypothetical protein
VKTTTLTKRQKDKAARRHFDLSGKWPVIRGTEWNESRYFDPEVLNGLTPDERSRLNAWMIANDREIRPIYFRGGDAVVHCLINDEVEVIESPDSRINLYFSSASIRHAEFFTIGVDNADDQAEAEAMFREWLQDIARVFAARDKAAASRLTA